MQKPIRKKEKDNAITMKKEGIGCAIYASDSNTDHDGNFIETAGHAYLSNKVLKAFGKDKRLSDRKGDSTITNTPVGIRVLAQCETVDAAKTYLATLDITEEYLTKYDLGTSWNVGLTIALGCHAADLMFDGDTSSGFLSAVKGLLMTSTNRDVRQRFAAGISVRNRLGRSRLQVVGPCQASAPAYEVDAVIAEFLKQLEIAMPAMPKAS